MQWMRLPIIEVGRVRIILLVHRHGQGRTKFLIVYTLCIIFLEEITIIHI